MAEVRTEFVHTGESASLYNCSLSPGTLHMCARSLTLQLARVYIITQSVRFITAQLFRVYIITQYVRSYNCSALEGVYHNPVCSLYNYSAIHGVYHKPVGSLYDYTAVQGIWHGCSPPKNHMLCCSCVHHAPICYLSVLHMYILQFNMLRLTLKEPPPRIARLYEGTKVAHISF